ncbi:uncharacterized protein L3040_009172 [Drepanopeziza brunnea f. sp. 'multigermtubi']|uniref:uncharacterized protein n=1 Tax=Drepanopeziza brunnea f. sp. 'multigermtubi' TaxID=698441 RepID=UPI0023896331|nr:hypothetical protein L3040_009172 [Drepanopeziza brunnea f. sp. 'multigermtubi']
MTTPGPSRRASQQNPTPAVNYSSKPHVCSCIGDERMCKSQVPVSLATEEFKVAHSFARVPINDLLNRPPSPPHRWPYQDEPANQPSVDSSGSRDIKHPMTTSATSSSRSASLISSDSTIRPPFINITEERGILLNALYGICMDATASHVSTLLPTSYHRHSHDRRAKARYHPYSPLGGRRSNAGPSNARPATLMDNISTICTHTWRKARGDEMAPHKAEADAVRVMRDLYSWSEVVVRGLDSNGDGSGDGDGDGGNEPSGDCGWKVGWAAKKLCQWLGDEGAWDECHVITGDLRNLSEREAARRRISEIDDESDESGNTC